MTATATILREPPCFTINACNRCRRRKAKCDPGLPSCAPCQRIGAVCEYTDPRSKTAAPRASILALEDELRQLEEELQQLQATGGIASRRYDREAQEAQEAREATASGEDRSSHLDLIRLEPGEDARFLGVSSGMHLARSVLESAQRNDASFQPSQDNSGGNDGKRYGEDSGSGSVNSILQPTSSSSSSSTQPGSPRLDGQQDEESLSTPTATTATTVANKTAPNISSEPILPSRETAISLIDIYLSQYEVQYPIVVSDDLAKIVLDCYGDRDRESGTERMERGEESSIGREQEAAGHRFILNMVFAIALVVLSRENPESLALAKTFSTAAMADFSTIMQRKNVRTLQCLLFLLLWSVIDSSSAPIWYISGLCMRMCVDLGFHSETTIPVAASRSGNGSSASEAEMDVKRRLFWVTYTFDRTLGTLLGRPFTLTDSMIDVQLPKLALSGTKCDQILHWFKLQQLQSQIVSRLYTYSLRGDDDHQAAAAAEGFEDTARWKADMAAKLRQWGSHAMSLADPSGHSLDWWEYWHQNAILLLHRPSPLKPQLDPEEADTCCKAAQHMVQLSFTRLQRGSADFAWVDLHYQLMSGITLLFLVWKHAATRARAKTNWTAFKNCLVQWTYVLEQLARQWERIARARDVLTRLVDTTIDIVEKELCNKLSASDLRALRHAHASRISRNKTIIRQLGSPGATAAAAAAGGGGGGGAMASYSSTQRREANPSQAPADEGRQSSRPTRRKTRSHTTQQQHSQQTVTQNSLHLHHPLAQPPQQQQQQYMADLPQTHHHTPPQTLLSHHPTNHQSHPSHHANIHTDKSTLSQPMQYEQSSYGGTTPNSDTPVNISQSVGAAGSLVQQDDYSMQISPANSGHQSISPPWIMPSGADPQPLVAPFHHLSDNMHGAPSNASGGADPMAQLLDQQAWHGLELYESFGTIPDNMTMLDYFSTTPMPVAGFGDDGSWGMSGGGGRTMNSMVQHGNAHAGGQSFDQAGGSDMVGAWPDALTDSILNFQTTFHDANDFGAR